MGDWWSFGQEPHCVYLHNWLLFQTVSLRLDGHSWYVGKYLLIFGCCLSGRLEPNGVHSIKAVICSLMVLNVCPSIEYLITPSLYCSNNMEIFYPVSMWNQYSIESQRTFGSWSSTSPRSRYNYDMTSEYLHNAPSTWWTLSTSLSLDWKGSPGDN